MKNRQDRQQEESQGEAARKSPWFVKSDDPAFEWDVDRNGHPYARPVIADAVPKTRSTGAILNEWVEDQAAKKNRRRSTWLVRVRIIQDGEEYVSEIVSGPRWLDRDDYVMFGETPADCVDAIRRRAVAEGKLIRVEVVASKKKGSIKTAVTKKDRAWEREAKKIDQKLTDIIALQAEFDAMMKAVAEAELEIERAKNREKTGTAFDGGIVAGDLEMFPEAAEIALSMHKVWDVLQSDDEEDVPSLHFKSICKVFLPRFNARFERRTSAVRSAAARILCAAITDGRKMGRAAQALAGCTCKDSNDHDKGCPLFEDAEALEVFEKAESVFAVVPKTCIVKRSILETAMDAGVLRKGSR